MSSRVRVYDLARELGLTSKELLALLEDQGVEIKSHASSIEPDIADLVRDHVVAARQKELARTKARRRELDKVTVAAHKAAAGANAVELLMQAAQDGKEEVQETAEASTEIHLKPPVVVRELADALGKKPNELIGQLMMMNVFAAINQVIDVEVVEKLCTLNGHTFVRERRERPVKAKPSTEAAAHQAPVGKGQPRPPVVAFLGHVDHGKTSLQDRVRSSDIAGAEAGGITQHIGASVVWHENQQVTLLDTPGHEAFTAMRARGANATDIVVLVVAADDGVMPQTVEAINHAKAAGVSLIVAMNKMDLPGANTDNVLVGLQQNGINPESWGGDTGVIPVSAMTGEGVDDLLERILLEAEMLELSGNPQLPGEGIVIEAQLESDLGPTANILVRNGTLRVGDRVLCGPHYGRIKAMIDSRGERVPEAGPSTPVKILGLSGVPEAGSLFAVVKDEKQARLAAEERALEVKKGQLSVTRHASLEDLFRQIEEEARAELRVVLKADVQGSLEAITDSLEAIVSEKIKVHIIHGDVGGITENDVVLAAASDAIVIGFHVRISQGVNAVAKRHGVEIRLYSVIYELLEEVKDAMRGRLKPEFRESALGEAEILQVFQTTSTGKICGCAVLGGLIRVGASAKVYRGGELIYNGQIKSLRRFKDDVREVRSGLECGIRLDNFEDFETGDVIKVAEIVKVAPKL